MPHLDEGVLQAWLDRPRSGMDASEAESVERHLAECEACAAQLAELEELTERTRSILSSVGPTDTDVPAFETVVRGGQGGGTGAVGSTGAAGTSADGRRRLDRLTSLAWAASVVLALGLGWATNDLIHGPGRRAGEPVAEVAMAPSQRDGNAPAAAAGQAVLPAEERSGPAASQAEPTPPDEARLADALPAPAPDAPQVAPQLDEAIVLQTPEANQRRAVGNSATRLSGAAASAPSGDAVLEAAASTSPLLLLSPDESWTPITRASASERVGFALLLVPDLDVLEVGVAQVGAIPTVRIVQQTASGDVITLFERPATEASAERSEADGTISVSARKEGIVVTVNGALSADSLQAILDDVR
jgi:hypothetical protein